MNGYVVRRNRTQINTTGESDLQTSTRVWANEPNRATRANEQPTATQAIGPAPTNRPAQAIGPAPAIGPTADVRPTTDTGPTSTDRVSRSVTTRSGRVVHKPSRYLE